MKKNKRKDPIEDFDWEKLEAEDKKIKSKKNLKPKKKYPTSSRFYEEEEEEVDPNIMKEMNLLTEEEKDMPYPDYFLADVNAMIKSINAEKDAKFDDPDDFDDDDLEDDDFDDEDFDDDFDDAEFDDKDLDDADFDEPSYEEPDFDDIDDAELDADDDDFDDDLI